MLKEYNNGGGCSLNVISLDPEFNYYNIYYIIFVILQVGHYSFLNLMLFANFTLALTHFICY